MRKIEIPGYNSFEIEHLIFDMNGTLSVDGIVSEDIKKRLLTLSADFTIHIITADTFGTAADQFTGLPLAISILKSDHQALQKKKYVDMLGKDHCIAFGNGSNDELMLEAAAIGIGICGSEGAASSTLNAADLQYKNPCDALDALIFDKRLIASLRR